MHWYFSTLRHWSNKLSHFFYESEKGQGTFKYNSVKKWKKRMVCACVIFCPAVLLCLCDPQSWQPVSNPQRKEEEKRKETQKRQVCVCVCVCLWFPIWGWRCGGTAAPEPELTAMLARAAVSIGLEVNRPPSPEPSRLDDWFLGAGHGSQRCLSSRRCMRSWRSRGWPLSRPEAARPPPPSSLPSTAGLPGGTRAFPRWRERSRCTCAHEPPPLGGTVRVSHPRPVSWQPLSRPKLIALRARQPPPCTPWLSCRFTKPRRSNRCTRVVPTRGWCRSCARRLTSLYEWRKSQRGPSGRRCPPWWSRSAISGSTWQRWRTLTRHAFSTPPSPRQGCSATPSRALPSSSRRYSSRPRRSSTSCPGVMHHPPLPPGPGLSLPVAVGALLRPPELLRPRPNRHLGRRVEPLAGERCPRVPARPQVVQDVDEAALTRSTRRCWNLLFLRRRREQRRFFPRWRAGRRIFCFILFLFRHWS